MIAGKQSIKFDNNSRCRRWDHSGLLDNLCPEGMFPQEHSTVWYFVWGRVPACSCFFWYCHLTALKRKHQTKRYMRLKAQLVWISIWLISFSEQKTAYCASVSYPMLDIIPSSGSKNGSKTICHINCNKIIISNL